VAHNAQASVARIPCRNDSGYALQSSKGRGGVLVAVTGIQGVRPISGVCGQVIDESGVAQTVQRAFANATGSGNTQVVAAQGAGVRIRVLSVFAIATTAVTIKFQSATTDISAGFPVGANSGFAIVNNHGIFQTAANEALNINLSGAVATGVQVTWVPA